MEELSDNLMMSEAGTADTPLRKRRKRIKNIFAQIRRQMEFYFSASNLHKDRFLKQKLNESTDGYVDLALFLNFNKIHMLTDDITQIAKAVKKSELLQLDEEKKRIRRAKPLEDLGDVDKRTVYVESLPPSADHEWISRVFGGYGKISYISLPRYHTSGDIKGFGFVEFETEDGAIQACQMHKPSYSEDQAEKPGRFPKYNKQIKQLLKQADIIKPDSSVEEQSSLDDPLCTRDLLHVTNSTLEKSLHSVECEKSNISEIAEKEAVTQNIEGSKPMDSDAESKRGERKLSEQSEFFSKMNEKGESQSGIVEDETVTPTESVAGKELESIVAKRKRRSEGESLDSESREVKRVRINEQVQVEEAVQVKYKRRRNRKRNKGRDKVTNPRDLPQLRVIPKVEWLRLKHEYLDLQKSSMKNLKATLKHRKAKQHWKEELRPMTTEAGETKTSPKVIKIHRPEKLEYIPDVVIRIQLKHPVPHTDIKTQFASFGDVAYVDVSDGNETYVRFKQPDSARNVGSSHPLGTCKLITGDEEKKYWERIQKSREKVWERKTEKKAKVNEKFLFTPDIIVKASLYHPLPRKDVKKQLVSIGQVLYVDLKDGDTEGYVRCANPEGANTLITSNISFGRFELVQGDEETRYWEKMQQDRDERYDKNVQRKKTGKRGVQKVVAQAEKMSEETATTVRKHVIFEDD